ncbi:MAG: serine/threonine protein kinase [Deltaproteobacteria bacterium]|nr:serine/threonine protein kinase [Deltaproteobacteria bacterium]
MRAYQADSGRDAPARLGRYELVGHLATGGMAEIHLARLAGEGGFSKLLVVKRLLPELVASPAYVSMFLDEGKLVARLDHPNICEVFELGRDGAEYFLAMPYLDGVPVHELIARPREPDRAAELRVAAAILVQACAGLHHAHELRDADGGPAGLVHRDVSPSNLFVTTAGLVKVLDFGVAKVRGAAETEVGTVKGKSQYMAPEQVLGEPLDRRCDVFALGIVAFELATHQRLFKRPERLPRGARDPRGADPACRRRRSGRPGRVRRRDRHRARARPGRAVPDDARVRRRDRRRRGRRRPRCDLRGDRRVRRAVRPADTPLARPRRRRHASPLPCLRRTGGHACCHGASSAAAPADRRTCGGDRWRGGGRHRPRARVDRHARRGRHVRGRDRAAADRAASGGDTGAGAARRAAGAGEGGRAGGDRNGRRARGAAGARAVQRRLQAVCEDLRRRSRLRRDAGAEAIAAGGAASPARRPRGWARERAPPRRASERAGGADPAHLVK